MNRSRPEQAQCVVVLIATANRADLLASRSLPSVLNQSLTPTHVVLVDDSSDLQHQRRVEDLARAHEPLVHFLRNRRTQGACGAWNTGLDHLARLFRNPGSVLVAILDDDDAWEPGYLAHALPLFEQGAEAVASPFLRIAGGEARTVTPPESLEPDAFLIGNPGIQASNLIVRLDRLLQAGCFDEALRSCTDRDLCIRLAHLGPQGYRRAEHLAVRHYACPDRPRLSTPGSEARLAGVDAFFAKWGPLMTPDQTHAAQVRAKHYFGWVPGVHAEGPGELSPAAEPAPGDARFHLIVGLIVDDRRLADLGGLLDDLILVQSEPGILELDCLILENSASQTAKPALTDLVTRFRHKGLRIHLVDRESLRDAEAVGDLSTGRCSPDRRLAIAPARTALQTYLYHFARQRKGAVVWILDDDMRLNPLVELSDGLARRHLPLAPQLQAIREAGLDIAIGRYTGAAPLPASATVRVQLVDLLFNLRRLARMDPESVLPAGHPRNSQLRQERRDYYYDLSHGETDRLEVPFLLEPGHPGETVAQALDRLVRMAPRILAGEQVFRPLVQTDAAQSRLHHDSTLHRGGNTFVFDIKALRDAPNLAPLIGERPTRRSDMIWALVQKTCFKRQVKSVTSFVYQERGGLPVPDELDVAGIADDLRGYAVFNALQDLLLHGHQALGDRTEKYLEERLAAFRLSFHRIRGLAGELAMLACSEPRLARQADRLEALASRIRFLYGTRVLEDIERSARAVGGAQVEAFHDRLPSLLAEHRARVAGADAIPCQLAREREANARVALTNLVPDTSSLKMLGQGNEGVSLTDGQRVFKVFDYWKVGDGGRAQSLLASCVGRWPEARSLYPLMAWEERRGARVLSYPYEPSAPYRGGHGPALVELMAECYRIRIICRNIHPKNLRRVGAAVRLIDYGSDLYQTSDRQDFEREFTLMCRRAFLSWRWAHRDDLATLMRQSLSDPTLPELAGSEHFIRSVRQVLGLEDDPDPVWMRAEELSPDRVLDFGCGKGKLAKHLADRGSRVIAYDPAPALQPRLESISSRNLMPVSRVPDALARGPFDLVICRRVACLIDDHALASLLRDLRSAVAPGGRVLFALCHPVYTPTCVTPEATPETSGPGDPECTFTWTKRLRASGRALREIHRPEHRLRRLLRRAGLRVEKRLERSSIDLERFEPIADLLVYELVPAEVPVVSLLIKACAMEAETLDVQIRHLVRSLEEPRGFAEVLLALDARTDGFLRQHNPGDPDALGRAAARLREQGWVDRIIRGPTPGAESRASNQRWFGLNTTATHAANGAQLASTLKGLDVCATRYVLHTDADIMIGRRDQAHDYLADMLAVLEAEPHAVTVAFNIAHRDDRPYSAEGDAGPWRTESRIGLLDLRRLGRLLPLPNELKKGVPRLPWHRALDQAVSQGAAQSLRGGDRRSFFVHPQNDRKTHQDQWFKVLDQIERGLVPQCQMERVDWTGHIDEWLRPERYEPFVFIIAGRNVPAGRFRRCLDSVLAQRRQDWGALVIDDASHPAWSAEIAELCARHRDRISLIRRRRRQGLLANTVEAIRHLCGDPASVIITLDADDCLIGEGVLDALAERYGKGADVTVGSMLRTDKHRSYPARLKAPRSARGGNVWQHLRSFRKALFDAIPDPELRQAGEYVDLANDWAYMLPLVELAQQPVHIETPLYLHEPSGKRDPATKRRREAVIAELLSRPPLSQELRMAQGEGK